jgi:hypothetical protein
LLPRALDAHGGLSRWREIEAFQLKVSIGGGLWRLKGLPDGLRNPLTPGMFQGASIGVTKNWDNYHHAGSIWIFITATYGYDFREGHGFSRVAAFFLDCLRHSILLRHTQSTALR